MTEIGNNSLLRRQAIFAWLAVKVKPLHIAAITPCELSAQCLALPLPVPASPCPIVRNCFGNQSPWYLGSVSDCLLCRGKQNQSTGSSGTLGIQHLAMLPDYHSITLYLVCTSPSPSTHVICTGTGEVEASIIDNE